MFALALEAPINQQALRGMEVTLAPERVSEKMVSADEMFICVECVCVVC